MWYQVCCQPAPKKVEYTPRLLDRTGVCSDSSLSAVAASSTHSDTEGSSSGTSLCYWCGRDPIWECTQTTISAVEKAVGSFWVVNKHGIPGIMFPRAQTSEDKSDQACVCMYSWKWGLVWLPESMESISLIEEGWSFFRLRLKSELSEYISLW